jgi:hypothetical protein
MPDENEAAPKAPELEKPSGAEFMSAEVKRNLDLALDDHRQRILEEADRLRDVRSGGDPREPYTPSDIDKAAFYVQGMPPPRRQSSLHLACEVVSYVAAILAGFFVNNIDEPGGAIGFAIIVPVGAIAYIASRTGRRRSRR